MKISIPKVLVSAAIVTGFVGGVFIGSQQFKPSHAESSDMCMVNGVSHIDLTTASGCAEPTPTPTPAASPAVQAAPLTAAQPATTPAPKNSCQ